ncbi:hypothetical protein FLW98_26980 [Raoultella planticola]|uniref:hypothetical protein n=1 Tax=Raoultella planticola TaxID=575 RepID=UPI00114EF287|nr:hypothetical protein [Raoultella planticola]TQN52781.1 hypothetical protein FLW98_26980 [Raoultella planticola]
MEYIGFDTIAAWYFGFGFFLWVVAQITRTDETQGVVNNLGSLFLFVVWWPAVILVFYDEIKKSRKTKTR